MIPGSASVSAGLDTGLAMTTGSSSTGCIKLRGCGSGVSPPGSAVLFLQKPRETCALEATLALP